MGRPRKPSHLRIVEGTDRGAKGKGRGKRIDREPVPPGMLDPNSPPADFDDEEAKVWREVLEDAPFGLLRRLDGGVLRLWCVAFVIHSEARRKLKASNLLIKGRNDTVVKNPYITILNTQTALLKQLAGELGFTPAARTRVATEGEGDGEDATDRFFA